MSGMRRRGLTLTEVLLATIILAMCMIPIASLIGFGYRGTTKDFRHITAIHLTEGTLNQVMAASYTKILATGGSYSGTSINLGDSIIPLGTIATAGVDYTVSLRVDDIDAEFGYDPILVQQAGFVASNPATWVFGGKATLKFDGSSASVPRKVKKVWCETSWTEPQKGAPTRIVRMFSYKVNLEDN